MNITTKFDINQSVWFVCAKTRKIKCEKVRGINAVVTSKPAYEQELRKKELVPTGECKQDLIDIVYELESASIPEWALGESKDYILKSISE